jgi:hypothetical protein
VPSGESPAAGETGSAQPLILFAGGRSEAPRADGDQGSSVSEEKEEADYAPSSLRA